MEMKGGAGGDGRNWTKEVGERMGGNGTISDKGTKFKGQVTKHQARREI
jgi:hypothetical protein